VKNILNEFVNTTESAASCRTGSRFGLRLRELGEKKMFEGLKRTQQLQKQFATETLLGNPAFVAQKKNLMRIMKTTTNLLMLCGSVRFAINNVTKS